MNEIEDDGFVTLHCTGCKSMVKVEVPPPDPCVNCDGGGAVVGNIAAGPSAFDIDQCPVCDGTGSIPSEHGPKYPYRCPECCGRGES